MSRELVVATEANKLFQRDLAARLAGGSAAARDNKPAIVCGWEVV